MVSEHCDFGDVVLVVDRRSMVDAAFEEKGVAGVEHRFDIGGRMDLTGWDEQRLLLVVATGCEEGGADVGAGHVGEAVAELETDAREVYVTDVEVYADVAVPSAVARFIGGLWVFIDQGSVGDMDMGTQQLDGERRGRRTGGEFGKGGVLD